MRPVRRREGGIRSSVPADLQRGLVARLGAVDDRGVGLVAALRHDQRRTSARTGRCPACARSPWTCRRPGWSGRRRAGPRRCRARRLCHLDARWLPSTSCDHEVLAPGRRCRGVGFARVDVRDVVRDRVEPRPGAVVSAVPAISIASISWSSAPTEWRRSPCPPRGSRTGTAERSRTLYRVSVSRLTLLPFCWVGACETVVVAMRACRHRLRTDCASAFSNDTSSRGSSGCSRSRCSARSSAAEREAVERARERVHGDRIEHGGGPVLDEWSGGRSVAWSTERSVLDFLTLWQPSTRRGSNAPPVQGRVVPPTGVGRPHGQDRWRGTAVAAGEGPILRPRGAGRRTIAPTARAGRHRRARRVQPTRSRYTGGAVAGRYCGRRTARIDAATTAAPPGSGRGERAGAAGCRSRAADRPRSSASAARRAAPSRRAPRDRRTRPRRRGARGRRAPGPGVPGLSG